MSGMSVFRRNWALAAAGAAILATVAVALVLVWRRPAAAGCPSGCASVNTSRTLPPFTVFYGTSCSGVHGSWFLNAVEGGPNDRLRPSYALTWKFPPGSATALPSGRVVIAPTTTTHAGVTLNSGVMALEGTRSPGPGVSASGRLTVRLTGSAVAPTLTLTETGLTDAETALGLVSPFDAGGHPLVVPVRITGHVSGC
jgi:hypothetical protein